MALLFKDLYRHLSENGLINVIEDSELINTKDGQTDENNDEFSDINFAYMHDIILCLVILTVQICMI